MLEDESGRIRLVGDRIRNAILVTGVIIAALGIETPNGEFEVVDFCCAGMPPHTSPDLDESLEDAITNMDVDGAYRPTRLQHSLTHLRGHRYSFKHQFTSLRRMDGPHIWP